MQRQAIYGLKVRESFAVNDETQKPDRSPDISVGDRSRAAMLALIRASATELLDKEAACCNLATD